jgi:hypothetical protein
VVDGEDNKPWLQMQSLPASAVLLSGKALLKGDRVPTVLVKEWQLTCSMFDGDQLLGPVPTLFADNVEVAKKLHLHMGPHPPPPQFAAS